ncbi:DUF2163 domain-containing protein [Pseudogemmobacter bohemicus]|uniref:DUF2163 domain-containing protein n=1 Tax=Pseudogemmobacter bohemicus TaxID=2250708 RepID=UPI000DD386D3|nr:DUF2163 domain-containing protein [Pseudogemmobacter bohemicus]
MTIALSEHLQSGVTGLCHLWSVSRRDGAVLGFTDHDCDLEVEGVIHRAGSGLTASALQQATGLAVDNSEAVGALSDAAITAEDLDAGRYDGAEVRIWLANWRQPAERRELFRGSLGEVIRRGASFRAELRGLSEPLGQPAGFAYTRNCSTVLGDGRCTFSLLTPGYFCDIAVQQISADRREFSFDALPGFDPRWFEHGRLEVMSGEATGLVAMIRSDDQRQGGRRIVLWEGIRAALMPGDQLRLIAGCSKQPGICRGKFNNFNNFRGFPHLPEEDWLTSYPRSDRPATGEPRRFPLSGSVNDFT